ncbi:MAG: carboxymuconolactone decarboxylase family protein [Alphaproteobacteria bacterium]|nr:fusion protein [Rhodobiaceae bacterium]MBO6543463.1 carboxymuconolactone decarboxylase family protein [Alphaproteobacteria bacterium]MBO6627464.1 carboxymuconolactone decarboxylase family protein [Alphaproteobacteria bacterium]MDF1627103.1 carboxymuconolactone decarboxylase family protein [Parvibaculaceae bacterium]
MSRLEPLKREDVPELEEMFQLAEGAMGFLPNSLLIMARRPELVKAFVGMVAQVNLGHALEGGLDRLIAYMASRSAGCLYCQAHTHHGAAHADSIETAKLEAIWEYETSPLFSEGERAALRIAQLAAQVPNGVSDADFASLDPHFSADQIVDIVAVISLFGFLNRWNDTFATTLEAAPVTHGHAFLAKSGWTAGKHA